MVWQQGGTFPAYGFCRLPPFRGPHVPWKTGPEYSREGRDFGDNAADAGFCAFSGLSPGGKPGGVGAFHAGGIFGARWAIW